MAEPTITTHLGCVSYWGRILMAVVKVTMLFMMQIMTLGGHQSWVHTRWRIASASFNGLIIARLGHTPCHAQRVLAVGTVILSQVHGVPALPVSSGDTMTDIAMKSYDLTRTSFITMATMGAIMTTIALINGAIAIIKFCSRGRPCKSGPYELPRHPAICETSAAAHAALGQRVSNGDPASDSGQELSSPVSEITASVDAGELGPLKPKLARPPQQAASMPAGRLSRGPRDNSSTEGELA
ncbi:hypothetical protein F5B21DRAFT_436161 [Xylaria acuta]|nr:hypothetical protein F5B21DRAFT_436161 [Xylaria acuta]